MIETERLFYRQFTRDDLPWLIEHRAPAAVNRYLGGPEMQSPEALSKRLDFYLNCYETAGLGMGAMGLKDTGELIGSSGLQPLEDTGEIEVGYNLAEKYWRQGYGYECAMGWLGHGFNVLGLERIVAVCHPDNTGSYKIMEKCGMRYETTEPHYGTNCVVYAIDRGEFLTQNA
jgi:[ribosomal protein S5]-alanine N-acetyltransferase